MIDDADPGLEAGERRRVHKLHLDPHNFQGNPGPESADGSREGNVVPPPGQDKEQGDEQEVDDRK